MTIIPVGTPDRCKTAPSGNSWQCGRGNHSNRRNQPSTSIKSFAIPLIIAAARVAIRLRDNFTARRQYGSGEQVAMPSTGLQIVWDYLFNLV
jgi:hypothetical protein